MSIAGPNLELLSKIAQKNSLNGILMDIKDTLLHMHNAATNAMQLLANQQEIENQQIQVQLDGLDPNTSDYTQQYQELITEQQRLTQEQTREAERLRAEWDAKERPYEMQQEDVETEVEAVDADIDGLRDVVHNNAQTEFGMFST
ncbi:hypothetical protein IJC60_01625 [bacterium]|nr:hypothetical protein [bacterium]